MLWESPAMRLFSELRVQLGAAFAPDVADVADPQHPVGLIFQCRPKTVV